MNKLIIAAVLLCCVGYSTHSYAVCGGGPVVFFCDTNPPNPDLTGIQEAGNGSDLTVNIQQGAVSTHKANPAI